jgi:hypothetical protein
MLQFITLRADLVQLYQGDNFDRHYLGLEKTYAVATWKLATVQGFS